MRMHVAMVHYTVHRGGGALHCAVIELPYSMKMYFSVPEQYTTVLPFHIYASHRERLCSAAVCSTYVCIYVLCSACFVTHTHEATHEFSALGDEKWVQSDTRRHMA